MLNVPISAKYDQDKKGSTSTNDWSWLDRKETAIEYGEETGIQGCSQKSETEVTFLSSSESDSTVAQNRLFEIDVSQESMDLESPPKRIVAKKSAKMWDQSHCPTVKLLNFKDLKLNQDEINGILSHRVIASSLSCLQQCPESNKYAYLKAELSAKDLTNILLVEQYRNLQYIDLSWNYLTDLTALGRIPYLMYLDVSHNRLTTLLDFEAPCNLTFVNYSHNRLIEIPDLTRFWSIVELNLAYNKIRKIEGLHNLKYLQKLNLSYNDIERFENLNHLNIVDLNLEDNAISTFEDEEGLGLMTLLYLFKLDLSKNKLSSLKLFEYVYHLRTLKLQANNVTDLSELENFSKLVLVHDLDLRENPIAEINGFREIVIHMLPNLIYLNGFKVKIAEKVTATNILIPNVFLKAAQNHAYLLLLEKLKYFDLDDIMPIDEGSHPLLILVGPWGSLKSYLTKKISENLSDKVCKAVCHTSRPQSEHEIDGINYYFVTQQEFNKMVRDGEFMSVTAILGKSYGFSRKELARCLQTRKLIIVHMDIHGALSLRCHNLNAKLVLIIPRSSDFHLERLRKKYVGFKDTKSTTGAVNIRRRTVKSSGWFETRRTNVSALSLLEASSSLKEIAGESVSESEVLNYIANNLRRLVSSIQNAADSFTGVGRDGYFGNNEDVPGSPPETSHIPDKIQDYINSYLNEFISSLTDEELEKIIVRFSPTGSIISYESVDEGCEESGSVNKENLASLRNIQEFRYSDIYYGEHTFLQNVLNTRNIYFSLNQENPGLFSATIFTDEFESAYDELYSFIRKMYHEKETSKIPTYSLQGHGLYKKVISHRLKRYHEQIKKHHSVSGN